MQTRKRLQQLNIHNCRIKRLKSLRLALTLFQEFVSTRIWQSECWFDSLQVYKREVNQRVILQWLRRLRIMLVEFVLSKYR